MLGTWYARYDVQKRYSVFYLIGSMASAFASILAYGLMQMNGLAGLTGWRWIFIMQGIVRELHDCQIVSYADRDRSLALLVSEDTSGLSTSLTKPRSRHGASCPSQSAILSFAVLKRIAAIRTWNHSLLAGS